MKQNKIDKILQLIKNDKAQENHLFKVLSTSDKPFPMLIPLKNAGYFNPDKNPSPVEVENQKGFYNIPHWNVLDYLENTAKHNQQFPLEDITNTLIDIVNSIIDYRTDTMERIENYRTDWILIKIIFLFPVARIQSKHIEFIRTALNSRWNTTLIASEIGEHIIPFLLGEKKAKKIFIELFKIVIDYKINNENYSDKFESRVDAYWLNKSLKKNKKDICAIYGEDIAEIALSIISQIIKEDESQFNIVWIPTIEDHSQTNFPDKYECQLIHLVRDCYQSTSTKKSKEKIRELLHHSHSIFNRLALHLINYHYNSIGNLLWEWCENPLEIQFIKHELYELIKNRCVLFTPEQINMVLKWIEENKYYIREEYRNDEAYIKKIYAYRKKEWLSALMHLDNQKIYKLFDKYNSINSSNVAHPGFDYWSEIKESHGFTSPINKLDFITLSVDEVVNYLNEFKEKSGWDEPTIEGLSSMLTHCVSENPEKYSNSINNFNKVKRVYQYAIIAGFYEAFNSNKKINWNNIFIFINNIIDSDEFWIEDYKKGDSNYRDFIISEISDLINNGVKKDQTDFDLNHLTDIENILLTIVNKCKADLLRSNDIITSVLNSVRGKLFTALLNYSLCYARLYSKKDDESKWKNSIKNEFTKRLYEKNGDSIEFIVIIGERLQNIYFLDKKWVETNINKIFPKDNDIYWNAAFTGYLFFSSTVFSQIYKMLSKNGHYNKALEATFEDHHITERISQHICVAYMEGWEKLERKDSLINKLLCSKNIKYLNAMVNFFEMQRNN